MVLVTEVEVMWLKSSSTGEAGTDLSNFPVLPFLSVAVLYSLCLLQDEVGAFLCF